jgi:hypothetical protein
MDRNAAQGRVRPARSGRGAPLALLLLSLLVCVPEAQAAQCVRESQSVRVAGQINRQRMTRLLDERVDGARTERATVVTMVLREPLCVMLPDDLSLALRPQRIREVQLLRPERLPTGRDQGILIDGKVLLAHSNAHHHPVLVEVLGIPATRNAAPVAAPISGRTTVATVRLAR